MCEILMHFHEIWVIWQNIISYLTTSVQLYKNVKSLAGTNHMEMTMIIKSTITRNFRPCQGILHDYRLARQPEHLLQGGLHIMYTMPA